MIAVCQAPASSMAPIGDAPGSPWAPLRAITAHTIPSYIATLGEKIRAICRCRLAVFLCFYPHRKQVFLCRTQPLGSAET